MERDSPPSQPGEAIWDQLGRKLLAKSWSLADHFAFDLPRDYDPDAFQGIHSDNILVIVDEAAVSRNLFQEATVGGPRSNAKLLAIGNPTNLNGTLQCV